MMNIQFRKNTAEYNCSRCLYTSNHPLNLHINNGVCSGCLTHLEKYDNKWDPRYNRLQEIAEKYGGKGGTYDCVVPVTGDAEDYFLLSTLLKLNLRPLVVSVNNYFMNDIGWHNFQNLITFFDLDSVVLNPELKTYKELVAHALKNFDSIYLPFLQLHTAFPVHVAMERKIKLIVWGQSQAIEQCGKFSHDDEITMSGWSRLEHDLFNVDTDRLIGNGAQVDPKNIYLYKYPNLRKLNKRGIFGIYLSNYIPWDPLKQNSDAVQYGFKPQENYYSFDPYERAGSSVYYELHDLLKQKKHGYRKVTDHLSREIRHSRISKLEALELQREFQNRQVYIKPFFDWIGSTESGYRWFVEHKLSDMKHLITGTKADFHSPSVSTKIKTLISGCYLPEKKFILFGKGVSI